jgi:hypothetical protein
MTNIKTVSAYDTYITRTIDIGGFENKKSDWEDHGGTFKAACEIPWAAIDISRRTHQTRSAGTDAGHIATLAADIRIVGLKVLPYVEWDKEQEKFIPLTGHHRLFAVQANFLAKNLMATNYYEVAVVEFPDDLSRQDFLQAMNNHRPAKPHTKADAVAYLKSLKVQGHFDDCQTIGDYQAAAYPLLKKYYPRIYTTTKLEVVEKAFGSSVLKKIKQIQKEELKDAVLKRHKSASRSGKVLGDVCTIFGVPNTHGKIIHNVGVARNTAIKNGNATTPVRVKITTHMEKCFSRKSLIQRRKDHLAQMKEVNDFYPEKSIFIEEVVYLPQVLLPASNKELAPIVYKWNKAKEKFV